MVAEAIFCIQNVEEDFIIYDNQRRPNVLMAKIYKDFSEP